MSEWNQARIKDKVFARRSCPICGVKLSGGDDRSGAFDDEIYCSTDKGHYRNFFSLFCDDVTIYGQRFDAKKEISKIEAYLDEVGNPEFK